jgi:hypothetical protein
VVVSAQHFRELTNGYEKTSSGLWTHKGAIQAGALRAAGPGVAHLLGTGPGVDIQYNAPTETGYVQAYDYSTGTFKDLVISGRTMSFSNGTLNLPANSVGASQITDGAVGTAELADGAVTTAKLANNAASALLAAYVGAAAWSTPATGAWYESIIQATATPTQPNATLRLEASAALSNSISGAGTYIGIGWGGAVAAGLLYFHAPAVNSLVPFGFTYYGSFNPGAPIRFAVFLYASAGVTTIFSGTNSVLYVTEQRR